MKLNKVIRIHSIHNAMLYADMLLLSQVRNGGHYSVPARPSRWMWDKFKDDVHFYFMLVTSSLTLDNEEM